MKGDLEETSTSSALPRGTQKSKGALEPGQDWRSVSRLQIPDDFHQIAERAAEIGRGRRARSPLGIPLAGWCDIIWRVVKSIPQDRVFATSGSVAFFALLAIFPAMATLISLYGLFADANTINGHLNLLAGVLPASALGLIDQQLLYIVGQRNNTLGLASLLGFLIALWSANSGVVALMDALNVVYREREKRSFLKLYATSFVFTLGGIVIASVTVGGVVVFGHALRILGLGSSAQRLIDAGRWPMMLLLAVAALALLYRYGPSRRLAKWRWVSVGSLSAALAWIGMSMLFSWYVGQFNSYNRVYGSLGAMVGLMTWIWFSVVVALVGAELNAEMELQTSVDTSAGRARPSGQRGARVADQVGEAQR